MSFCICSYLRKAIYFLGCYCYSLLIFCLAHFSGFLGQEYYQNADRGSPCERRNEKGRSRQKFTHDNLQILKQFFEQNPYPDLTDKKELANEIHGDTYVIDVSPIS